MTAEVEVIPKLKPKRKKVSPEEKKRLFVRKAKDNLGTRMNEIRAQARLEILKKPPDYELLSELEKEYDKIISLKSFVYKIADDQ